MPVQERIKSQHRDVSDGTLAQQSLQGDQEAFEHLVRRYSNALFDYICRFLNDDDTASDILQQVFLQLYLSLPKLRTGEPLKGWLYRVAHNRCLDELRRKRVIHFSELQASSEEEDLSPLDTIPDHRPLPEEVVERHDVQMALQEAIAGLPPKFRAVVLLRYTAQLSFAEIGHTLQMPEATAKTYFQRAKPLLRTMLKHQIYKPSGE